MTYNQLLENHHVIQSLWDIVNTGAGSLDVVCPLVKKVLKSEAWKEREVPTIGVVKFTRFVDFITTRPLKGCGWSKDKVEKLIKDDDETLTLYRKAITAHRGGDRQSKRSITDIVSNASDKHGNSKSYTLDRLERERPDLYQQVLEKKLSANKAAIEAGFRHKPTPLEIIERQLPKLSIEELHTLRNSITMKIPKIGIKD